MTTLALALAVTLTLVALPLVGLRRAMVVGTVFSLTVGPAPLLELVPGGEAYVVGVAAPSVTVYTYTVALVFVAAWALITARVARPWLAILPLAYVPVAWMFLWPDSTLVTSGAIHLALVCLAWLAGVALASEFDGRPGSTFAAWLLLIVSAVLAMPSWYQWVAGIGVEGFGDRTGGIFAHPSTVGKVALVVIALALPLTRSDDRRVTRLATFAAVMSASASVPTLSRANILGVVLIFAVWFVVRMDMKKARQMFVVGGIGVIIAAPLMGQFLQRFALDPEGSDRPELLAAGLRNLAISPLTGIGPNTYVPTIAPLEPIVAITGFPVHNVFLLAFTEIGLVGLAVFVPMMVAVLAVALPWARVPGSVHHANALFAMAVALAFVGLTGWGLLRAPMPELIAFGAAVLWSNARAMNRAPALPGTHIARQSRTSSYRRASNRGGPTLPPESSGGVSARRHTRAVGVAD